MKNKKDETFLEKIKQLTDEKLDEFFDDFDFEDRNKFGIFRIENKDGESLEFQIVMEMDKTKFVDDTLIVHDCGELEKELSEIDKDKVVENRKCEKCEVLLFDRNKIAGVTIREFTFCPYCGHKLGYKVLD